MEPPKVSNKPASGFGILNILGLIFLITGILLIVVLTEIDLPVDLSGTENILEYGAAIGSILGGLIMLFKKHESVPEIRTK